MALKTSTVTIQDDGRDRGKVFLITEMPAWQAEKWAIRLMQGATRAGLDVPANIVSQGMLSVAYYGITAIASMRWEDAEPLLDEVMACIKIIRDPSRPDMVFDLLLTDIEEVATRLHLRAEVFKLHTNFSMPGAPLKPPSGTSDPKVSPTTPTSHQSSGRPSPRKRPRL